MSSQPKRLIVDVFELARTAGHVAGQLALRDAPQLRAGLADDAGAIDFSLHGYVDAQGHPCARLRASGELSLVCDRCGHVCPYELNESHEYCFVANQAELDRIPVTVDALEHLIGSRHFDVTQLVEDEAILAIPLSPRHEECEPSADASNVVENHDVSPEESKPAEAKPNPFAELAKLKRRLQ